MGRVGRDDLTIDFVRGNMPQIEQQDSAAVVDDWVNRVANLPAEIAFMQEEIIEKDRQMAECLGIISKHDSAIQKFLRITPHQDNPKEELHYKIIRENYDKAEKLQAEKLALSSKTQLVIDKHTRHLDKQIKALQDRGEFPNDVEIPSLLRPQTKERANGARAEPSAAAMPLGQIANASTPHIRHANQHPMRTLPGQVRAMSGATSSAPATPAGQLTLLQQQQLERERSMVAATAKRQKLAQGVGIVTGSTGIARHTSLTPGTPLARASTPSGVRAGSARAGSAGPRATQKSSIGNKRVAPSGSRQSDNPRKGGKPRKSMLSKVKGAGNRNSPSSTNDSELSEAETGDEDDEGGTPPPPNKDGGGDDYMVDVDDEEAGDDRKYCICQKVSYGDMVACDNMDCKLEWFHWSCVGLKSEPEGTWFCPDCIAKKKEKRGNS